MCTSRAATIPARLQAGGLRVDMTQSRNWRSLLSKEVVAICAVAFAAAGILDGVVQMVIRPYWFGSPGDRIVYVREVAVKDLPDAVQREVGGLEKLYAVHDAEGQQLALVATRQLAFTLARQNDYAPVAVH